MPSTVELLISAVGAEQAGAAVQGVSAKVKELAATVAGDSVKSTNAFSEALEDQSSVMRDVLSPALSDTTKQLLGLAAASVSIGAVYSSLKDAISQGSDFVQLSRRTGESVRDLVILRQAFTNAGLGAEYVGTAANLLDRVLSGTTASGRRTSEVFEELHLSIDKMRTLTFTQQLQELGAAFARLPDQAARSGAAMTLFGRYAGGQMLQLLGDADAFKRAEDQAGSYADRMSRDAGVFNDVALRFNAIKVNIQEMALAAAEQLVPALESVARVAGGIHLSSLGTFAGAAAPGILGTIALTIATDQADMKMVQLAERFSKNSEGGLVAGIMGAASKTTGLLATALPFGLAAVIGAEIVKGILMADWQDTMDKIDAAGSGADNLTKKARGIRTDSDRQAVLALAQQALTSQQQAQGDASRPPMFSGPGVVPGMDPRATAGEGNSLLADSYGATISQLKTLINELTSPKWAKMTEEQNQATDALTKFRVGIEQAASSLPQLQEQNQKLRMQDMDPAQRVGALQSQLSGLQAQRGAPAPAGASANETAARNLGLDNQILPVKHEIREAEKQITEEQKKQTDLAAQRQIYGLETQMEQKKAAGDLEGAQALKEQIGAIRAGITLQGEDLALAKQRAAAEHEIFEQQQAQAAQRKAEAASRQALEGQRTALENALQAIRNRLNSLDADTSRTEAQKWADRKAAIAEEIKDLQAAILADQLAAKAAAGKGDQVSANQYAGDAAKNGEKLSGLKHENVELGPDPNNWVLQTQHSLNDLMKQLGTTSQQIAQSITSTIGNAFNSIRENIVRAITVTGDWKRAIGQIGLSIEQSLVGAFVNMAVQWAEKLVIMKVEWLAMRLGMAAADKGVAASSTAALVPLALATSAIWAAPAALATIATFGGAAAAAPMEIAASMAASQGLALASSGGYFPGDPTKARGIFHGDEFVLSAPAVRNMGGGAAVTALHQAALQGPAQAAAAKAMTGGGRTPNIHTYIDKAVFMRAIAPDVEAIAHTVSMKNIRQNA